MHDNRLRNIHSTIESPRESSKYLRKFLRAHGLHRSKNFFYFVAGNIFKIPRAGMHHCNTPNKSADMRKKRLNSRESPRGNRPLLTGPAKKFHGAVGSPGAACSCSPPPRSPSRTPPLTPPQPFPRPLLHPPAPPRCSPSCTSLSPKSPPFLSSLRPPRLPPPLFLDPPSLPPAHPPSSSSLLLLFHTLLADAC